MVAFILLTEIPALKARTLSGEMVFVGERVIRHD